MMEKGSVPFGIGGVEPWRISGLPPGVLQWRFRADCRSFGELLLLFGDRLESWYVDRQEDGSFAPGELVWRIMGPDLRLPPEEALVPGAWRQPAESGMPIAPPAPPPAGYEAASGSGPVLTDDGLKLLREHRNVYANGLGKPVYGVPERLPEAGQIVGLPAGCTGAVAVFAQDEQFAQVRCAFPGGRAVDYFLRWRADGRYEPILDCPYRVTLVMGEDGDGSASRRSPAASLPGVQRFLDWRTAVRRLWRGNNLPAGGPVPPGDGRSAEAR